MRSGSVAALGGLVLLAAGCTAPGVPGLGAPSIPPTNPAANAAFDPTPAAGPSDDGAAADAGSGGRSQGFRTNPTPAPSGEGAAIPGGDGERSEATPRPTPGATGDGPVRVPPPKLSDYTYVFPVQGCKVSYARKLLVLPKTTIWAKRGCRFVAPIDGTVHEVNRVDRWSSATDRGEDREGKFVSIIGVDGVRYLGGHLASVASGIKPGVKVKAGQVLGRIGNSGNAAGQAPNLYFAVSWKAPANYWWVRRGMVKPWNYLDAWYNGNRTYSPRKEMLALRKRLGATPPCTVLCTSKQPQPPVQTRPTQRPTQKPKPKPTKKRNDDEIILTPGE